MTITPRSSPCCTSWRRGRPRGVDNQVVTKPQPITSRGSGGIWVIKLHGRRHVLDQVPVYWTVTPRRSLRPRLQDVQQGLLTRSTATAQQAALPSSPPTPQPLRLFSPSVGPLDSYECDGTRVHTHTHTHTHTRTRTQAQGKSSGTSSGSSSSYSTRANGPYLTGRPPLPCCLSPLPLPLSAPTTNTIPARPTARHSPRQHTHTQCVRPAVPRDETPVATTKRLQRPTGGQQPHPRRRRRVAVHVCDRDHHGHDGCCCCFNSTRRSLS